ncbi:Hypothetical predicted protein [Podarcis lilfordi]|uniref:Uncharacterized protein n=1 Tax=Podarcis lilfordi TaxID=74358 RepID=A0AA35KQ88_9SAUR|nr:Hypothetical predicted protein [Podarcis lilfordi]
MVSIVRGLPEGRSCPGQLQRVALLASECHNPTAPPSKQKKTECSVSSESIDTAGKEERELGQRRSSSHVVGVHAQLLCKAAHLSCSPVQCTQKTSPFLLTKEGGWEVI